MGVVYYKSSTLSQPRETIKSCNMPPIVDDEVIDAAKEEKTEDAADGKAAEPEAAEAGEEKKEEEAKEKILAYYSTKIKIQTMVFFNSNTNYLQALKKKNPSLQKQPPLKFLPLLAIFQ